MIELKEGDAKRLHYRIYVVEDREAKSGRWFAGGIVGGEIVGFQYSEKLEHATDYLGIIEAHEVAQKLVEAGVFPFIAMTLE